MGGNHTNLEADAFVAVWSKWTGEGVSRLIAGASIALVGMGVTGHARHNAALEVLRQAERIYRETYLVTFSDTKSSEEE